MKNLKKIIALFLLIFFTGILVSVISINTRFKKPEQNLVKKQDSISLNFYKKTV